MRNLTQQEVSSLLAANCEAEDWTQIFVSDKFTTERIRNTRFSGRIVLGKFEKTFTLSGGLKRHSGIRNATLHNCEVGDDSLIENVANHISNYRIGRECYLQNINVISVEKRSTFGIGTEVCVLNETGGREVPIYPGLSSSLAYIIALYRHNKPLIECLNSMIRDYAESHASEMGTIGDYVKIQNTGTIKHVNIGDYTKIVNSARLENGTIVSNRFAPVYVGDSVIAQNFILSSGSHIADAAKIIRCFIGQACHVSHNFSAHDSLMFANCAFENGEACAIFAGPFTVTMHKSSLLIAGMFSFLNAGSGSNQSNHMYKLGPIHQGIIERGSKTTSDSYILWPAKVGAFSLVMGRHYRHSDTSCLPFSYLIEKSDETYLVPGVNLRSVGTIRDVQKWPKRDKRTDPQLIDCINYNLLSPYTISKMIKGCEILNNLRTVAGETSDIYYYQSTRIKNSSLRSGITLYEKALNKFFGNSLISRLGNQSFSTIEQVRQQLLPTHPAGEGEWTDLSGLIVPKSEVQLIKNRIMDGTITLEEIESEFCRLHADYYDMEWTWTSHQIELFYGIDLKMITSEELIRLVRLWENSVISLDEMLLKDAQKEFDLTSMIGFGVDGSTDTRLSDFESVRGEFESNPFVTTVRLHIETKSQLASTTIKMLQDIV